ncbi:MAG: hypothetical protein WCG83_05040 [Candidatus Peregrinibacteria bacterium]
MQQSCKQCSVVFEISPEDLKFYDKASPVIAGKKYPLPPPTLCPHCREQRRLAFRNQQTLYKRTCDHCHKPIVSIYSPDKPHKVYCPTDWWSDKWDAIQYGRDYDFTRPFFVQFRELMVQVPHMSVLMSNCQNSDYTNQSYNNRDCYLSSAIKDCEGAIYCQNSNELTDCMDSSYCFKSQLLSEATDTYDSYNCTRVRNCIQCTDSAFLYDCIGCNHCFGCVGLRNKSYQFFNEQLTKEEYERRRMQYPLQQRSISQTIQKQFNEFILKYPHLAAWMRNCENTTGNNVRNSRNSTHCFDCNDIEDCRYSTWVFQSKDAVDCYGMGGSQITYENVGTEEVKNVLFSFGTSMSYECIHTDLCFSCHHCFGCVGLRNKSYCIFNKQYTEEAYAELVPKIIAHMQSTREWGEFFPASLAAFAYKESKAQEDFPLAVKEARAQGFHSPVTAFAYNETKAFEDFPLTKDVALAWGFSWKDNVDEPVTVEKIIPGDRLPDNLDDIPDDILNWAIRCSETGRPYRVTKKELAFYRQQSLPVPTVHPDVRSRNRLAARNPRELWKRNCKKCGKPVETTYGPNRAEIIYCEECYLKEMY